MSVRESLWRGGGRVCYNKFGECSIIWVCFFVLLFASRGFLLSFVVLKRRGEDTRFFFVVIRKARSFITYMVTY